MSFSEERSITGKFRVTATIGEDVKKLDDVVCSVLEKLGLDTCVEEIENGSNYTSVIVEGSVKGSLLSSSYEGGLDTEILLPVDESDIYRAFRDSEYAVDVDFDYEIN